ncbi:hypothetical protein Pmani_008987 [Petrolisthes manimaculis]|uniref:Secreted protein n=1 Tax=Petrolisthes manimaculis TaxID=1843537 RepID=A0AAE1UIX8_9EUCA|nr:hypothetical protein Pmani_008987 [Petrolisthes manimaculis]
MRWNLITAQGEKCRNSHLVVWVWYTLSSLVLFGSVKHSSNEVARPCPQLSITGRVGHISHVSKATSAQSTQCRAGKWAGLEQIVGSVGLFFLRSGLKQYDLSFFSVMTIREVGGTLHFAKHPNTTTCIACDYIQYNTEQDRKM